MEYLAIIIGLSLAHPYMGKTIPLPIYPPKGRDQLAYVVMALSFYLYFENFWYCLALFAGFWGMMSMDPAQRLPWLKYLHWFPDGRFESEGKTFRTLALGFGWKCLVCIAPVFAVHAFLTVGLIQALGWLVIFPPLTGLSIAGGYFAAAKIFGDGRDLEGKLMSFLTWALVICLLIKFSSNV